MVFYFILLYNYAIYYIKRDKNASINKGKKVLLLNTQILYKNDVLSHFGNDFYNHLMLSQCKFLQNQNQDQIKNSRFFVRRS